MKLISDKRVHIGFFIGISILLVLGYASFFNNQRLLEDKYSFVSSIENRNYIELAKLNAISNDEHMAVNNLGFQVFQDDTKSPLP